MKKRINAFWDWFVRNSERLQRQVTGARQADSELFERLQRVHRGMSFELGLDPDLGFHLILSADGNRDLFTIAGRIIDAAPKLEGWTFTALRPRRPLPLSLDLGPADIDSRSVWFEADQRNDRVDLVLCFRDLPNEEMRYVAAFLLLDAALGEFDVETKVGRIDCRTCPPDPEQAGLLPFGELPGLVDAMQICVM